MSESNDVNRIKTGDSGIDALIDVGRQQTQPFNLNGVPVISMPAGHVVEKFPDLAHAPPRIEQRVNLHDLDSFVEYYGRFADQSSAIFIDKKAGRFVAVIDYHENAANPTFCKHIAEFAVVKTDDWYDWLEINGDALNQVKAAEFIEDHLDTIVNPDGATMLEVATSLSARTETDFKQAIRLDNGSVQFKYSETVNGQAGKSGELSIPSEIALGLVPFEGADRYEIKAKFRYRIRSGALTLSFHLSRPEKVWESAINDTTEALKKAGAVGTLVNGVFHAKT